MNEHDELRGHVSKAYAEAVTKQAGSCCCGGEPAQSGALAKLAGYSKEELDALPADAVTNSFGCGNPVIFSGVSEGDVVVDLGSGAGIDLLLAAKRVGPTGRVIGVDMTDEMIERASQNIAAAGLTNVEVRKGIIEDLPVETGTVDWVISNCVINLSPEKPKVFAEIARVLKPGGRMLVSDVVVRDLPLEIRENQALYNSCVAGAISEGDYVAGLEKAGLGDVEVRDRITYEASQLTAFMQGDLAEINRTLADSGKPLVEADACGLAESLAGKVWSAIFFARRTE